MKKAELIFGAVLLPIDYLMLVAAGFTAYFLRFNTPVTQLQPVLYEIPFNTYAAIVLGTALVWIGIFSITGLYRISATRRLIEEARKVFLACSTGVLVIIILFFLDRDLFSSRFIILAAYGLSLLYVAIARMIVLYIERYLFRKGIGVHHVVLIGENRATKMISNEIANKKGLGLQIALQFDSFSHEAKEKMLEFMKSGTVDELIQTDPNISKEQSEKIYDFCDEHHIVYKYAAALLDTQSSNISIQPIAGVPIVEIQQTRLDGWGRIAKRIFDIIGSLFFLIFALPIIAIAALATLIDSGRPIFFTRRDDDALVKRVGQHGKEFFYFKLRSMKPGTDSLRYDERLQEQNTRKDSPLVKIKNDPRITRVGKWIRRFSIDELPELFLVLKGDMSLVGPRPHLPEEVAKYKKHHKRVLTIKPGMTGLAQISGRSDLVFDDEVKLDIFYIENWALWLDIVILIKTPFVLIRKRKAL